MYPLGQKFNTIDPAKTLLHESGIFELVSPKGETFRVECHAGASIASLVSSETPGEWYLTKIANVSEEPTRARAASSGR